MRYISVLILVASLAAACKNSKKASQAVENEKQQTISDDQNEVWKSTTNEDGDYTLFYQEIESNVKNPRTKRDFYILDSEGNRIFDQSIYGGYVRWYDNSKVEFFSPPGTMPKDSDKDDFIMIYDITKGTSYTKSQLKD